jgi:hypothetical protein
MIGTAHIQVPVFPFPTQKKFIGHPTYHYQSSINSPISADSRYQLLVQANIGKLIQPRPILAPFIKDYLRELPIAEPSIYQYTDIQILLNTEGHEEDHA